MNEPWSTATIRVSTPRGLRYQGVVFAGPVWPYWKGMLVSRRLPRGARAVYRTRLFCSLGTAFEMARSRTIHHNLYHADDPMPHSYRCRETT